jgi:CRISPR/Cas system-associated protein Cas10 (large subunit of type III CRISPR-Cas system)
MHKLVSIYHENQDSIGYFLKLFRLGKEKGVTPEQIIKLVQMADSIHMLEDKLQWLQSEISDISIKETFDIKYDELKEVCFQVQKLQDYVEQFKDGQDYMELESTVRGEVEKILSDNKKLLQNALFSILLALRNDPDRYFIVDSVGLTYFANTVIN